MKITKQSGFSAVEALLIIVLVGVVGFASWYVYHSKNNADSAYNNAANLKTAAKNTPKKVVAHPSPTPPSAVISDSLKENTAAAIDSKNTAALQGYMASSVNVVVAGSEKQGAESTALAVKDLDYFKDSVSPWNFSLDAATLTSYKNGSYGTYFGTNTIVGKSTDGMVVSFGVNSSGKIDTIFMAAAASLLTE